jgi:hypothetical protein
VVVDVETDVNVLTLSEVEVVVIVLMEYSVVVVGCMSVMVGPGTEIVRFTVSVGPSTVWITEM